MNPYSDHPTNELYIKELVVENTDSKDDINGKEWGSNPYSLRNGSNKDIGYKTYVQNDYVILN